MRDRGRSIFPAWLLMIPLAGGCITPGKNAADGEMSRLDSQLDGKIQLSEMKPEKPSAQALTDFGFLELSLGELDKAEDLFQRAIQTDSKCALAYVGLAKANLARNRLPKAIEVLERGQKKAGKSPEIHNELAVIKAQQGDFAAAIAAEQKAVQLQPDREEYQSSLAGMLAMAGRYDEALEQYRKVVSPGEARYRIAGVLHHRGDRANTLAQLDAAIKEEPGHRASMEMLARLNQEAVAQASYQTPARIAPPVPLPLGR